MRRRHIAVAALLSCAISVALATTPQVAFLDGLSLDLLFLLRTRIFGPLHDPASSPTVVVGFDEETNRTPPFADTPGAMWTPQVGKVLDALVQGDAKVVGFDVIYSTTTERFKPGYDRDFLLALRRAAREDKVVLGKVQHSEKPVRPFPAQSLVVGNEKNIRALNLLVDADEIVRRIPLTLQNEEVGGGQRRDPSMALELAARALGLRPTFGEDGTVSLGPYRIPRSQRNEMVLNFDAGADVPLYSFADLYACAEAGNIDFFREHFAGKVVLLGAVLDVEDRLLTSKRYIAGTGATVTARCATTAPETVRYKRDIIPGVFIHATAVDNLVRGEVLAVPARWLQIAIAATLALAGGLLAMMLIPLAAGAGVVVIGFAYTAVAVVLFRSGIALPVVIPVLSAAFVAGITFGYRTVVADRDKRFLRKSFSLYLAPAMVDKMIAEEKLPELGGEQREVTIYFSDVAGFTSLSETMSPHDLVSLMNEYLAAMTDIIEAHQGYVDNFIGDAIMAVFGAPLDDPLQARHAVDAALACATKLEELNATHPLFAGRALRQRIGLNTGDALVGNIGSHRNLRYTVLGDAVNLAARLEGANKFYGTSILVSEAVVERAGDDLRWREIDAVRVKGRSKPVTLYEPLAAGAAPPLKEFAAALEAYRAARFDEAAQRFAAIADLDPPAVAFAARARQLASAPPSAGWDPVTALEK